MLLGSIDGDKTSFEGLSIAAIDGNLGRLPFMLMIGLDGLPLPAFLCPSEVPTTLDFFPFEAGDAN